MDQRIAKVKLLLEGMRDQLAYEIAELHSRVLIGDTEAGIDTIEASDVSSQRDIDRGLIEMKQEMLDKIAAGLGRISVGSYGLCRCKKKIETKRLIALPFAVRCKECEEALESPIVRQSGIGRFPRQGTAPATFFNH